MQMRLAASVVASLALLAARVVDAQVLTGTLFGTVIDESGGVVPGAVVHVDSPALIGGPAAWSLTPRGRFDCHRSRRGPTSWRSRFPASRRTAKAEFRSRWRATSSARWFSNKSVVTSAGLFLSTAAFYNKFYSAR